MADLSSHSSLGYGCHRVSSANNSRGGSFRDSLSNGNGPSSKLLNLKDAHGAIPENCFGGGYVGLEPCDRLFTNVQPHPFNWRFLNGGGLGFSAVIHLVGDYMIDGE